MVNGERSTCTNVICGVLQGSILEPLLFIIYLEGITQIPLHHGSSLLLYAEDILLYHKIQVQEDYLLLQQDIATLETILHQKYLQLNDSKCKYIIFRGNTTPFILHILLMSVKLLLRLSLNTQECVCHII